LLSQRRPQTDLIIRVGRTPPLATIRASKTDLEASEFAVLRVYAERYLLGRLYQGVVNLKLDDVAGKNCNSAGMN